MKPKRIIILFSLFIAFSCNKNNNLSLEPIIEFSSINKLEFTQGRTFNDSIFITITFEDGDGDIGDENNTANVFVEDSRDGAVTPFSTPVFPEQAANNGVSGDLTVLINTLFNVCCYFPNGQDPCTASTQFQMDSFHYKIYIEDRAGNRSNVVKTNTIFLLCQ